MYRISLLTLLLLVFTAVTSDQVTAFTATDYNASIEVKDIDIAPTNTPTPQPNRNLPTIAPENLQSHSDVKKTQREPKRFFTFSLAASEVDFGIVDPTNPVIRTHRFLLNPGNARSLSLFAYENHDLRTVQNDFIPLTSCDDGSCTTRKAAVWENTLTYGFGFRCESDQDDDICASLFQPKQSYRRFADVSHQQTSDSIVTNSISIKDHQGTVTYKLNIPGTQKPGSYTNSLVYIAAPGI